MKKTILFTLFILFTFFSVNSSDLTNVSNSGKQVQYACLLDDGSGQNTYVRELRDGIWWIIVYAPDGSKINEYVDPIQ